MNSQFRVTLFTVTKRRAAELLTQVIKCKKQAASCESADMAGRQITNLGNTISRRGRWAGEEVGYAKSNGNKAFVFSYPDLIPELNHSQAREHRRSRFMQMNGNARARAHAT